MAQRAPRVSLDEGEAVMMAQIVGMMEAMPTPALAAMLGRLREHNEREDGQAVGLQPPALGRLREHNEKEDGQAVGLGRLREHNEREDGQAAGLQLPARLADVERRHQLRALHAKEAALQTQVKELTARLSSSQGQLACHRRPPRLHPNTVSSTISVPAGVNGASFDGEETVMLAEIAGMLQALPTQALPDVLARLRSLPLAAPEPAPAIEELQPPPTPSPHENDDDRSSWFQPSKEMQSGRASLLRQILLNYFRQHAPEGLGKVEDLVARVVGGPPSSVGGVMVGGVLWSEQELFGKLEAKYKAKVDLDPHGI